MRLPGRVESLYSTWCQYSRRSRMAVPKWCAGAPPGHGRRKKLSTTEKTRFVFKLVVWFILWACSVSVFDRRISCFPQKYKETKLYRIYLQSTVQWCVVIRSSQKQRRSSPPPVAGSRVVFQDEQLEGVFDLLSTYIFFQTLNDVQLQVSSVFWCFRI